MKEQSPLCYTNDFRSEFKRRRSKLLQQPNAEQLLLICINILKSPKNVRSEGEMMYIQQLLSSCKAFQPILSKNPELIEDLSHNLGYDFINVGLDVFQQGDVGDKFYIILQGKVSIRIKIPDQLGFVNLKEVAQMEQGQAFGELALQGLQIRSATVTTLAPCHFATLDKITYRKLIGDFNLKAIENKVQFMGVYEFFKNWSSREMKSLCYELVEKHYQYGEKLSLSNYVAFILNGQVELRRQVENRNLSDHPLKASKIHQETLTIDILDEHSMLGELNFLDNYGNLMFTVDANREFLPNTSKSQLKIFIKDNRSNLYEAFCYTTSAKVYLLKVSSVMERFFDVVTRTLFQRFLKKIINQRLKKAWDLTKQFEEQHDVQREQTFIKEILKRGRQGPQFRSQQRKVVRSYKSVDSREQEFRDRIEHKLIDGLYYKFRRLDSLESQSRVAQTLDVSYERIRGEEEEAKEKFMKMSQSMNFSYSRIKNYFHLKRMSRNKLFYQAFLNK